MTTPNTSTPAWAANAPLNAWIEIPGTAGAGGTQIESYSGWAKLPNGKIAITLAGGHSDGQKNSTAIIDMLANAPVWVEVGAESLRHVDDIDYQPDGKPTASHIYYTVMWVPPLNRLMRIGCLFASGGLTKIYPHVDGFDLTTNTWSPAGTHPDIPAGGAGKMYNPVINKVLVGDKYFDPVTGNNTAITLSGLPNGLPRFPWCWDSTRNQAFGMCLGDGQGYNQGAGIVAAKVIGYTATPITIAASAARDQFVADAPLYCALEHDPVNDWFLLYEGRGVNVGRVYKIIPNSTSAWSIEIFTYNSGGITPSATVDSGIMNKFSYISELGGVVMMTNKRSNLYFMRTSSTGSGGVVVPPASSHYTHFIKVALKSPITQSAAPFSFGYAFRQGDVPAGAHFANIQVTPLNVWPDGSLKIAHVAGTAALAANVSLPVTLAALPAPATSTAIDTAALKATNLVATIGCGAFGTVSWSTADWDTPFETWISGPYASTWRYRKPVGSDSHLVAWLEVTLFAGGEVEVFPWVENGYCRVPSPANKNTTYTFTLGGTQRCSVAIDLKHHQRTPIINGTALSYWLGNDPKVTPIHDKVYLQSTELVPTYSAVVSPTSPEAMRIEGVGYTSYVPLQPTGFEYDYDFMPSSGYQRPIGLLPMVDVLYLTTNTANTYGAVVRNGFSAGRYHSHFRDEATNKPILFSEFPHFTLQDNHAFGSSGGSTTGDVAPTISGGNLASWDTAHSPLVGYMAYLLTGRKYFAEETQFAANFDYIGQGDNSALRAGSQGLMRPEDGAWQTRAAAWQWRTRSAALTITPDSDIALRAEYTRTIENTIVSFHNKYIAQTNNPWGVFEPGGMYDNDNYRTVAAWMEDFYTASIGWSICQELSISPAHKVKLAELFAWKAKSVVLRLGTSDKFWYVNPMPYQLAISPPSATLIDYKTGKGPWLSTEAAIYDATYNPLKPAYQNGHFSTVEGVLQGEYDPSTWVVSMLGNMMPAISYAVRHGVPGAAEGYARLTGATNWPTIKANFNLKPVWSVVPAEKGIVVVTTPAPYTPPAVPPVVLPVTPPVVVPAPAPKTWKITSPSSTKLAKLKNLRVCVFDPVTLTTVKTVAGVAASTKGVVIISGTEITTNKQYAATVCDATGKPILVFFPLVAVV